MKTFRTWLEVASREGDWDKMSQMFQHILKTVVECLDEKGFKPDGEPRVTKRPEVFHIVAEINLTKTVLGIPANTTVKLAYEFREDNIYDARLRVDGESGHITVSHRETTIEHFKTKMLHIVKYASLQFDLKHMILYGLPPIGQFAECLAKKGLVDVYSDPLLPPLIPAAVRRLSDAELEELRGWREIVKKVDMYYYVNIFKPAELVFLDPSDDRNLGP